MKISFAICSHNEGSQLSDLIISLNSFIWSQHGMGTQYEIVLVDDFSTDVEVHQCMSLLSVSGNHVVVQHALNSDFAAHKNFMNAQCTGDWILNLDADETIPFEFLDIMPLIIEGNPDVEAYWLPRVNTVRGLTLRHVQKWQWLLTTLPGFRTAEVMNPTSEAYELLQQHNFIVSEENGFVTYNQPIICWPDLQMRLYKNDARIRWDGKVHERLIGFGQFSVMPLDTQYAIRHYKDIERQEKQNNYYETIQR